MYLRDLRAYFPLGHHLQQPPWAFPAHAANETGLQSAHDGPEPDLPPRGASWWVKSACHPYPCVHVGVRDGENLGGAWIDHFGVLACGLQGYQAFLKNGTIVKAYVTAFSDFQLRSSTSK